MTRLLHKVCNCLSSAFLLCKSTTLKELRSNSAQHLLFYLATFQPPDFTADMYDSIPVDDMDFEDIEWQKWLQGLVNSGIYHVHVGESLMMCKFSMLNAFICYRQSWVFAKK